MAKWICNWCATTCEAGTPGWTCAALRIDGLRDGSISWLPERILYFCAERDCRSQVRRVENFLLESPFVGLDEASLRVWFRHMVDGTSSFDESRYWAHEGAAEDARALANFFTATSHPKLRRVLEAFEP